MSSGFSFVSRRDAHLAGGVCAAANAARHDISPQQKTADFGKTTVRSLNKVGLKPTVRTISILLPNTIHGCKDKKLGRSK